MLASDLLFVLAQGNSRVAGTLREANGADCAVGTLVLPGLKRELSVWVERLALLGPVFWHCHDFDEGIRVILIDESNEIAVCCVRPVG